MDRRFIVTLLLVSGGFFAWQSWQNTHKEPTPAPVVMTQQTSAMQAGTVAPAETRRLVTSQGEFVLSSRGAVIQSASLKSYSTTLLDLTQQEGFLQLAFDDPELSYLTAVAGKFTSPAQETTRAEWLFEDARVRIVRTITAQPDRADLAVQWAVKFKGRTARSAYVYLQAAGNSLADDQQDQQALLFTNGSVERSNLADSASPKEWNTRTDYIGAANRYFVAAIIAQSPWEPRGLVQPLAPKGARLSLVYPVSGTEFTLPVRLYFGPKDLAVLRSVEPKLDHTVDFGWFTLFAYPLLNLLKWLYGFVHNYGVAIIILTLLLKIATFPLTYKSMKSMKEMARLQPQIQKLKDRYKDDKEALNREMLTLMRSNGYNPVAGCLPLLIQMPIFFALYRVLYGSIELYHAPFAFWIGDLSAKDPIYITPVAMTLLMFLQQKLTPNTATDPAQQKMIQFMPLIFGVFMLTTPSGLAIYMFVNAAASILQQLILNRKLGITSGGAKSARA